MQVLRLSSEGVPPGRTTRAIRDLFASVANSSVDLCFDQPLHVELAVRPLPGVTLAYNRCSPSRAIREAKHIDRDENDDLLLYIVTSGEVVVSPRRGPDVVLRSGDVYLQPNEVPTARTFTRTTTAVDVGVPRRMIEPVMTPHARARLRSKVGSTAHNAALALLAGYVHMLVHDQQPFSSTAASLAATHLQDLFLAALGTERDRLERAKGRGVRAARLAGIKADVITRVTRATLSVESVARRHGLSPQYVRALFRDAGTTFSEFVRNERLKLAYRKLTDSRFAQRPIRDIALECGFTDVPHFTRAFHRRYGMTPSDARTMGQSRTS